MREWNIIMNHIRHSIKGIIPGLISFQSRKIEQCHRSLKQFIVSVLNLISNLFVGCAWHQSLKKHNVKKCLKDVRLQSLPMCASQILECNDEKKATKMEVASHHHPERNLYLYLNFGLFYLWLAIIPDLAYHENQPTKI